MKYCPKIATIILFVCLAGMSLLAACGDDDGDETKLAGTPTGTLTPTTMPSDTAKKVKITIGNLTDKTGPASQAMQIVDTGLADIIRYYNDNELIPGVEVDLVEYDGRMDPARNIPGWEWLKQKGADVIMAWMPADAATLKHPAEQDQIPLFVANTTADIIKDPGYMFATAPLHGDIDWTMINWVLENDWDWQTNGPAKVGGALDENSNPAAQFDTFAKYAEMYPERMEWVEGVSIPMGVYTWANEVPMLKDCDYIFLPHIFPFFVKDYVNAGLTKAKFLTHDGHTSFLSLLDDMGYWPEIDGLLNITQSEWWTEDSEYSNFARELAGIYHSGGDFDVIEENPKGYNSFANGMHVLESIKIAAENVGPENIDSQAIYEAAQQLVLEFDGIQRFSFSETKRISPDRLAMHVANADTKGFDRISEWFSIESSPE